MRREPSLKARYKFGQIARVHRWFAKLSMAPSDLLLFLALPFRRASALRWRSEASDAIAAAAFARALRSPPVRSSDPSATTMPEPEEKPPRRPRRPQAEYQRR